MTRRAFIGVDCGGTQCRIAWTDGARRVDFIGRGANFTNSPSACARAIAEAAKALSEKSGISYAQLCEARAYLGVAGIMTAEQASQLRKSLPFADAIVEDDRKPLVVGALAHRDGFVGSIGTGSFYARRTGGVVKSLGGWGLILGDEASGAWLGRGLLRIGSPVTRSRRRDRDGAVQRTIPGSCLARPRVKKKGAGIFRRPSSVS